MKVMSYFGMAACVSVGVAAPASWAAVETFESFTVNQSVNGQGQWTVEDSFGNSAELFDESIIDDGSGNKVWRVSNAVTSGSLSNQPYSSKAPLIAGETGAGLNNDYGTDHTMPNNPPLSSGTAASKYLYTAFDFKSATGAAQPGLYVSVSPSASQSTWRNSFVGISDNGSTGFDLEFYDTTGTTTFNLTTVASALSYSEWHSVEIFIEYVDGIAAGGVGNDVVKINVNGVEVHVGTTWESLFSPTVHAADSAVFALRGTAAPGTLGNGLLIDNVDVSNLPEPTSALLLAVGAVAIARRRTLATTAR